VKRSGLRPWTTALLMVALAMVGVAILLGG